MEQVLELVFKTAEGDTKVITVTDPRTDITAEEAQAAKENKTSPDHKCERGFLPIYIPICDRKLILFNGLSVWNIINL